MFHFQGQRSSIWNVFVRQPAERDNCFGLFMFLICSTQCFYWCVFVFITNHAQLSIRIQRMPLECEIIQIIPLQRRGPGGDSILNFSKENYVFVCVTWWNDCHGKLNLTWKEMSKNEKNHHKFSLYEGIVPFYKGIFLQAAHHSIWYMSATVTFTFGLM